MKPKGHGFRRSQKLMVKGLCFILLDHVKHFEIIVNLVCRTDGIHYNRNGDGLRRALRTIA